MRKISKEAFVTIAKCTRTKNTVGITVDRLKPNLYSFVWAFKIDERQAKREGYGAMTVHGDVKHDEEFPGCPHCGAKKFGQCEVCGTFSCSNGEIFSVCPSCGANLVLTECDDFTLEGGGL